MKLSTVLLLIAVAFSTVSAATYSQKNQLETDLLTDYNKNILPLRNQSDTVDVSISAIIYTVTDIDPIKGVVILTMGFPCQWNDELIQWNSTDYGGVNRVLLLQDQAWTPSITVVSSLDQTLIGEDNKHKVLYNANGNAWWTPHHPLKLLCTFYMKYWPFDKHICKLVMVTIDYSTSDVLLSSTSIDYSLVSISEWVLEDVTVERSFPSYYSFLTYQLKFKRDPAFYVLTLLLPITLIGFLLPFVFLLPSDSGERVGFSITIMLSLAVFLTVISDEIPRTTNPVALICGYIMMLTISSVIVCIMTILNLKLHHTSNKVRVGKFWRVVGWCKCSSRKPTLRELILKRIRKNSVKDIPNNKLKNMHTAVLSIMESKTEVNGLDIDKETENDIEEDKCECTWPDISNAVDKYLFIFTAIIIAFPSVIFLSYLSLASDYQTEEV
ncbi:Neuronal acetylcholine receptor subunit alpha-7 [Mactra antiquata]